MLRKSSKWVDGKPKKYDGVFAALRQPSALLFLIVVSTLAVTASRQQALGNLVSGINSMNVVESRSEDEKMSQRPQQKLQPKQRIEYPVFVTSLYKSGTTSVHRYFKCGGINSAHKVLPQSGRSGRKFYVQRVHRNIIKGKDPFGFLQENYGALVYADNDDSCFHPSVSGGLELFYKHHPNATLISSVRSTDNWFDSVLRYNFTSGYSLIANLLECPRFIHTPEIPQRNMTVQDVKDFYEYQIEYVRNFAKNHPSMTYIEISLEDDQSIAAATLEAHTGIDASCWGQYNKDKKNTPPQTQQRLPP